MSNDAISLIRKLAPDLTDEIARRALILDRISSMQPVGRRQLAIKLNLPEREIRNTASLLKELGYIELNGSGMILTDRADEILQEAREFSKALSGLTDMESEISRLLDVDRVMIVSGYSDDDNRVLQDLGRACATKLKLMLQNGNTLAVTGGTTMAAVVKNIQPLSVPMNIMVVPARGGLGRSVETQANTLAAQIAGKLGGHHRLIHLPDTMDESVRNEILKLTEVKEVLELLERADIVLHGIGIALKTMKERNLSHRIQTLLVDQKAVGESFGAYFDLNGKCLLESSSIGINLAKLSSTCRMIGVAAGSAKAEAIISVLKHYHHTLLIIDESAANGILKILSKAAGH